MLDVRLHSLKNLCEVTFGNVTWKLVYKFNKILCESTLKM